MSDPPILDVLSQTVNIVLPTLEVLEVLTQTDYQVTGLSDAAKIALDIMYIIKEINADSQDLKGLSAAVIFTVGGLGELCRAHTFGSAENIPPELPALILMEHHPGLCFTLEDIKSKCRRLRFLQGRPTRIQRMLRRANDSETMIKEMVYNLDQALVAIARLTTGLENGTVAVDPLPLYTPQIGAGASTEEQAPSELLPDYTR